jgi:hypothetical protein
LDTGLPSAPKPAPSAEPTAPRTRVAMSEGLRR